MGGGHGKRVNNDGMPGTTSGACLRSEFGSRRATNPWRAIPTIGTSRNRSLAIGTYSPVSDWGRCAVEAAHMSGIWQTFLTVIVPSSEIKFHKVFGSLDLFKQFFCSGDWCPIADGMFIYLLVVLASMVLGSILLINKEE